MVGFSNQQSIEVNEVNSGNGFLLIKQKEIKIIQQYSKILHVINLTQYDENIQTIKTNIIQISTITTIPETTLHTIKQLEHDFNTIIPHHVEKRGLINIIGKGLKLLVGTMDADDENDIKTHFDEMEKINFKLTTNSNKQININLEFSNKLQQITKHINEQQKTIQDKINKIENSVKTIETKFQEHLILNEIKEHIDTLHNQIKIIKENILLSRLEILGRDILSNKEINENKIDATKLPFIKSSVLLKGETIVFALLIPTFTKETFFKAIVEPIPNHINNLEIELNNKFVIINHNSTYLDNKNKNIRYKDLIKLKDGCLSKILEPRLLNCIYKKNNETLVYQVTSNIIITKNLKTTNAIHNCNEQQELVLEGNNIIKFENCKIKIEEQEFLNMEKKYYENIILPNSKKNISITEITNNFTLKEIHLKGLNNLEEINDLKLQHKKNLWTSTSCDIFCFCLIIIIIVLISLKLKGNINSPSKTNVTVKFNRQESIHNKGGVTSSLSGPFN